MRRDYSGYQEISPSSGNSGQNSSEVRGEREEREEGEGRGEGEGEGSREGENLSEVGETIHERMWFLLRGSALISRKVHECIPCNLGICAISRLHCAFSDSSNCIPFS